MRKFGRKKLDIHFVLRPGYEELAEEMVMYAKEVFPDYNGEKQLMFSKGQKALIYLDDNLIQ